jgi:hypothetical protein
MGGGPSGRIICGPGGDGCQERENPVRMLLFADPDC